jgi:DNA-binding transcriptional regulator YiaG
MDKQYRDEIAMVCHDMMKSAYAVGAVTDSEMKEFEEDCFTEEPEVACETEKSPEMAHITA